MRNTGHNADCIQSLNGAIENAGSQYIITAAAQLYDPAQRIHLTVVLQKSIPTWDGRWEDIFVFSSSAESSASVEHEMRLSSGTYRVKIIADVYASGETRLDSSVLYSAERTVP